MQLLWLRSALAAVLFLSLKLFMYKEENMKKIPEVNNLNSCTDRKSTAEAGLWLSLK